MSRPSDDPQFPMTRAQWEAYTAARPPQPPRIRVLGDTWLTVPYDPDMSAREHVGAMLAQAPQPVSHVTPTCACHCGSNHPGFPGVCEAASTPGLSMFGQPTCLNCRNATTTEETP